MQDIEKLIKGLSKVKNGYKSESQNVLENVGSDYQENVKANTPVDSGKLKESIQVDIVSKDTIEIYSNVEYAPFVELGHLAKNGKFVKGSGMFQLAEESMEQELNKQVESLFDKLDKMWGD